MVDISLLQSLSYVAAAIGVCAAAIYYMFMLRINMKTRQMETCRLAMTDMSSEPNMSRYATVMTLEWKDYDDFNKKYGWSNPEVYGKWISQCFMLESMGVLVKSGVAPAETIYYLGGYGAIYLWEKYKGVIQARRDAAFGQDYMIHLEYLAGEMMRVKSRHDPSYSMPESLKYSPSK